MTETTDSIHGHTANINLSDTRPIGWTAVDEALAAAEYEFGQQLIEHRRTLTQAEWDAKYIAIAGIWQLR